MEVIDWEHMAWLISFDHDSSQGTDPLCMYWLTDFVCVESPDGVARLFFFDASWLQDNHREGVGRRLAIWRRYVSVKVVGYNLNKPVLCM